MLFKGVCLRGKSVLIVFGTLRDSTRSNTGATLKNYPSSWCFFYRESYPVCKAFLKGILSFFKGFSKGILSCSKGLST